MSCKTLGMLALACLIAGPAIAADKDKKCVLQRYAEMPVTMVGTHPTVSGTINGQKVTFLADSGAFFSVLSVDAVERLGLKTTAAPMNLIVRGTSGSERMRVATAQQFTLAGYAGGRAFEKVDFLVSSGFRRYDGIIGQNLIGHADTEYDLANGVIRIFNAKDCKGTNLAYWSGDKHVAEIEVDARDPGQPHLIGDARLNGKKIRVMFDTGASLSVLTLAAAERAGIEPEDEGVTAGGLSQGIGKKATENFIARFDTLDLGGEVIKNARLRMGDIRISHMADMLLGADFFLSHRVYVDSKSRQIYFTYNGGPVFDLRHGSGTDDVDPASIAAQGDESSAEAEGGAAVARAAAATTAADGLDAAALRRRGAASAGRNDFDAAIADFDRAIVMDPQDAETRYQRGQAYLRSAKLRLAATDFDEAIKLKPDYVEALLTRGSLNLARGQEKEARADFDKVQSLRPDDDQTRFAVAEAYGRAGKHADAISVLDAWVVANPKDKRMGSVLFQRCGIRARANLDLPLALSDCNEAIRKGVRNSASYEARALTYLRLGKYEESIDDYSEALDLQPKNARLLYGRGLAEIRQGQKEKGDASIKAATALDAGVAATYSKIGLNP